MTFLTTKEVAKEIGVHRDTLLRWLREGRIPEPDRDGRGWRRFSSNELYQLKDFSYRFQSPTSRTSQKTIDHRLSELDWDFSTSKTGYLTHNIHPYPAKFIPQIPNQLIQELSCVGDTILDPFCGSGTTILEALYLRRNAIGIDANPLACLISRAKISRLQASEFEELEDLIAEVREMHILLQSDQPNLFWARDSEKMPAMLAAKDLDFWFSAEVQKELSFIKAKLQTLRSQAAYDVAATCFSAIIVGVSRQDSDTRYTRRDKTIVVGETLGRFADQLTRQLPHLMEVEQLIQPDVEGTVICADVLDSPEIPKANLIVTSPPYPNAYSYHLYHRTRMLWLDIDQADFKRREIGSHRKYSSRSPNACTVETFRSEMLGIVRWLVANLESGGYLCFILGTSKIRGEIVRNDNLIIDCALECGLELTSNLERNVHQGKKSFNPINGRIKTENIVVLRKGS